MRTRTRAIALMAGLAPATGLAQPVDLDASSGRVLVRAFTPAELAERYSLSGDEAQVRYAEALARVAPGLVHSLDPVGIDVVEPPAGVAEAAYIAELIATGDYAFAEPDLLVHPLGHSDDPDLALQWQLDSIGAFEAWDYQATSSRVCAFLDTGIDTTHPDLAPLLVPGYNAVNKLPQAQGGSITDVNGHGTSVAGVACAVGNNAYGGSGVGWSIPIMPVRVTNSPGGGAFLSDVLDGGIWAAENGAAIVSASYSGVQSASIESTGKWMRTKGVLLVWAADDAPIQYVGWDHPNVTIVGATTKKDVLTASSAFGSAIDVVAPGAQVWVPKLAGAYGSKSGTSYAAPIAAGVMAMIAEADPALTPAQIEAHLFATCTDLGVPGKDDLYGHGRVHMGDAVRSLLQAPPSPGLPYLEPGTGAPRGEGLLADYFLVENQAFLPDFASMKRFEHQRLWNVDYPPSPAALGFAGGSLSVGVGIQIQGLFLAPATGEYTFTLESSDGSKLWLDNTLIVDHDGVHAFTPKSGPIGLVAGAHRLTLGFFCGESVPGLVLRVAGPGLPDQVIPASLLKFELDPADMNADGRVDLFDFLAFQDAYASHNLAADIDHSGHLDIFDFLAYQQAVAVARY